MEDAFQNLQIEDPLKDLQKDVAAFLRATSPSAPVLTMNVGFDIARFFCIRFPCLERPLAGTESKTEIDSRHACKDHSWAPNRPLSTPQASAAALQPQTPPGGGRGERECPFVVSLSDHERGRGQALREPQGERR